MNPIVHAELSWLLGQSLRERRDRLLVVAAGLAPDFDGLSILAGRQAYAQYHHLLTHGAVAALAVAVLLACFAQQRWRAALMGLAAFHLHLLCDLIGSGPDWPVAYLWPFSERFWGWAGAWELASWPNAAIALASSLLCLGIALTPLRRTVVEIASLRVDRLVVRTLRQRFLGERGVEPGTGALERPE